MRPPFFTCSSGTLRATFSRRAVAIVPLPRPLRASFQLLLLARAFAAVAGCEQESPGVWSP